MYIMLKKFVSIKEMINTHNILIYIKILLQSLYKN